MLYLPDLIFFGSEIVSLEKLLAVQSQDSKVQLLAWIFFKISVSLGQLHNFVLLNKVNTFIHQ